MIGEWHTNDKVVIEAQNFLSHSHSHSHSHCHRDILITNLRFVGVVTASTMCCFFGDLDFLAAFLPDPVEGSVIS